MKATEEQLNWEIGQYIGSQIEWIGIPQLSIDVDYEDKPLPSYIVKVSDEDIQKYNGLSLHKIEYGEKGYDEYRESPQFKVDWEEYIRFRNGLYQKYLPKTVLYPLSKHMYSDVEALRTGINHYLWDTDISMYIAKEDFLFEEKHYLTIKLTRDDD